MHQSIPPKTSPGPGAIAESQVVPPPGPPAFSLHVDGPVPEDALYISRDADDDLFEGLLRGELCSLLAPPRSGKSSLAARVARRLQGRGVRTANIDLQRISHRVSVEGFAYALVGQLAEGLGLGDPTGFFVKHEALSPSERFSLYLREELLNHVTAPVVVFIDEIDALQMLRSGADEFAAVIRGIYEDRPQVAALRRLSFCLVGSQPPEDLLSPRPSQTSMPTAERGRPPSPARA